jgi:hypothetical protein
VTESDIDIGDSVKPARVQAKTTRNTYARNDLRPRTGRGNMGECHWETWDLMVNILLGFLGPWALTDNRGR